MKKATDKNPTTTSKPNTITPLFTTNYNVYINHTDAGGIVYHANHLVFFENCRRDWFTQLGLNGYFLESNDGQIQHFVVTQADLQYKHAILLDEVINVRIDNVEIKPASIVFYQSIYRQQSQDNTANNAKAVLLSSTKIVVACVQNQITPDSIDNNASNNTAPMRPVRVPQKLRDAIERAIAEHIVEIL
ncbi:possible thioesterase [Psychrobacter arcticus 273-4]|uniref:Possible thioesterase n=1 Tax=Psychrobacter arcticus (strain DSM 17307 / VKM B-2377 / 273-4) TaxID=259536 RepID=Q4FSF7_PSYA2|nr:thioesterase family protein [Psychrobacter arcticus]AAZ19051.1 possible thioesterase [Psychrobacter arcticus 273-4]